MRTLVRGKLIPLVCVLNCLPTEQMAAQTTGTVRSAGALVPDVRIELWSPTAKLAQRLTSERGEFRFTIAESQGAVAIVTLRLGYASNRVATQSGVHHYDITIDALPTQLPGVTTIAESACPNVDTEEARAVWLRAARWYASADTFSRGSELTSARGEVPAESLGTTESTRLTRGSRGTTRTGMAGYREAILNAGYVRATQRSHFEPDYGLWIYPALEADYASHFVESLFAQNHDLQLVNSNAHEDVLGFCPKDRRRTGLEGTLRVSKAGGLLAARWTYWNPARNREIAGGEVVFAPPGTADAAQRLPPLAVTGLFWRRLPSGRYYQHWREYDRWVVVPDDRLPHH